MRELKKYIILMLWGIFLFLATISLFVMTHEGIHAIRLGGAEMMCIGFGEDRVGFVTHQTIMSGEEILKEEVIANTGGLVMIVAFLYITTYLVINNIKGGS